MTQGLGISRNALGMAVIRLHYTADPAKDTATEEGQQWYARIHQLYPDPVAWEQEFEINWWIAQGTRVYPEFSESLHGVSLDGYRPRKVVYRAWDFGWHAPACLFAQLDSKERLVLLREMIGREQTTRDFAQQVLAQTAEWFPHHTAGFRDFCDPAGQQQRSTASERSEARDVEVLKALGIHPTWEWGWSRKDGRSLVHQLLVTRTDGTPSLYVETAGCPVLTQGFLGKYVYPPRKGGHVHFEPDESSHPWADIHACLRYLTTGLYSALGLRRPVSGFTGPAPVPEWHGYGTPKRARR